MIPLLLHLITKINPLDLCIWQKRFSIKLPLNNYLKISHTYNMCTCLEVCETVLSRTERIFIKQDNVLKPLTVSFLYNKHEQCRRINLNYSTKSIYSNNIYLKIWNNKICNVLLGFILLGLWFWYHNNSKEFITKNL